MNKPPADIFRIILRVMGTIAALFYLLFLIFEGVPLFKASNFADISVYLLFLLFALGYYFLWRNELISGIIILIWYALEWILVFWVWVDGGMTLILGLPISLLGIFTLIYGAKKTGMTKKQ